MSLGFSTAFDQSYECRTCELTDLDRDEDVDRRTWRCKKCGHPVWIHLENEAGDTELVERHPACELVAGDFIVLEQNISMGLLEIKGSNPAMGKGNRWFLGIENVGHHIVERDKHYNCMPRA